MMVCRSSYKNDSAGYYQRVLLIHTCHFMVQTPMYLLTQESYRPPIPNSSTLASTSMSHNPAKKESTLARLELTLPKELDFKSNAITTLETQN